MVTSPNWLVVWNILKFPIYWESSSQLTFIFFRGVAQPPTSKILRTFSPTQIISSLHGLGIPNCNLMFDAAGRRVAARGPARKLTPLHTSCRAAPWTWTSRFVSHLGPGRAVWFAFLQRLLKVSSSCPMLTSV